jgi:hypothetical protein
MHDDCPAFVPVETVPGTGYRKPEPATGRIGSEASPGHLADVDADLSELI